MLEKTSKSSTRNNKMVIFYSSVILPYTLMTWYFSCRFQQVQITSKGAVVKKHDKPILNRTIKSIPLELLKMTVLYHYHMMIRLLFNFIFNSNFIICTDRAMISFDMLRWREKKMQFWKCSCIKVWKLN